MNVDITHLQQWIGRTETLSDVAGAVPLQALAATLDREEVPVRAGDPLPPGAHWLYFLPLHRQSELGPDGHARRGGFLPPVPLPRRMWAGSRIDFLRPLLVGDALTRRSTIADVRLKQGRSGPLVFVRVRHEIAGADGPALLDEHDIVYRAPAAPGETAPPPPPAPEAAWAREVRPDPVLLWRYSALTFNGHRIHYDHPYATSVEGYPGLVVHGPLMATLLLDLLQRQRPQARLARFTFRALRPVFDTHPFHVCGRDASGEVHLWVRDHEGLVAMDATATLA